MYQNNVNKKPPCRYIKGNIKKEKQNTLIHNKQTQREQHG